MLGWLHLSHISSAGADPLVRTSAVGRAGWALLSTEAFTVHMVAPNFRRAEAATSGLPGACREQEHHFAAGYGQSQAQGQPRWGRGGGKMPSLGGRLACGQFTPPRVTVLTEPAANPGRSSVLHARCCALSWSPSSVPRFTDRPTPTYPPIRRHHFTREFPELQSPPSYSQSSPCFLDHTAQRWPRTHWPLPLECGLAPPRPVPRLAHGRCPGGRNPVKGMPSHTIPECLPSTCGAGHGP